MEKYHNQGRKKLGGCFYIVAKHDNNVENSIKKCISPIQGFVKV